MRDATRAARRRRAAARRSRRSRAAPPTAPSPDGFSFATEGLRFRLAERRGGAARATSRIARSAAAGAPPRVEVRADGIDLKIAATLIDYFPVPRDIKDQVLRFAPRGRIADASLALERRERGASQAYAREGPLRGPRGERGRRVPGRDRPQRQHRGHRGGRHAAARREAAPPSTLERIFRAPLAFDTLERRRDAGSRAGDALEVAIDEARFANADARGPRRRHVALAPRRRALARLRRPEGHALARHGDARRRLPAQPHRGHARLARALDPGGCERPRELRAEGRPRRASRSARRATGIFLVEGDVRDGALQVPPRLALDRRDRRHLPLREPAHGDPREARDDLREPREQRRGGDRGPRGAAARCSRSTATSTPPAPTRVRFLRESPLVNGPGAFTRAVVDRGAGAPQAAPRLPARRGTSPVRVAGDYQFAGATATVARDARDARRARPPRVHREERARAGHHRHDLRRARAPRHGDAARRAACSRTLDAHVDAAVARRLHARGARRAPERRRRLEGARRHGPRRHAAHGDLRPRGARRRRCPSRSPSRRTRRGALEVTIARLGAAAETTTIELAGDVHGRVTHRSSTAASAGTRRSASARRWPTSPCATGSGSTAGSTHFDVDAWQALFAAGPDGREARSRRRTPARPDAADAAPPAASSCAASTSPWAACATWAAISPTSA